MFKKIFIKLVLKFVSDAHAVPERIGYILDKKSGRGYAVVKVKYYE